jgi:3-isopropylmalate/(R)-2-methylmalate dehydratase small subunit
VLVAGDNFGCGSSREHAPWALLDFGFRAVISTSFADIFRNNAVKTGLLPVALPRSAHTVLLDTLGKSPNAQVTIDLETQTVTLPDGSSHKFPLDPFARHCLLNGVDELGFLLDQQSSISFYESSHPARISTR